MLKKLLCIKHNFVPLSLLERADDFIIMSLYTNYSLAFYVYSLFLFILCTLSTILQ